MNQKEKMIKILTKMDILGTPTEHFTECLADHLIANGVIVLPCSIGDVVYTNMTMQGWYMKIKDSPYKAKVAFIGINGTDNFINIVFENDNMLQFKFSDIGKTVFLNREEAEKTLKEHIKNE